jgi:hypothetical protein
MALNTTIVNNFKTSLQSFKDNVDDNTTKVTELKALTGSTSKVRYDKLLEARDIIGVEYTDGLINYVSYDGDNVGGKYYRDVLVYTDGLPTSVKHFYNATDTVNPTATTTLTYVEGGDDLITKTYSEA